MVTIIAGSRNVEDYNQLLSAIDALPWKISKVVSGCARGVDKMGEKWARENDIPIDRFPANWNGFGKSAGYVRNLQMAQNAQALLALWDSRSKGTGHMIKIAYEHSLKVFVWRRI